MLPVEVSQFCGSAPTLAAISSSLGGLEDRLTRVDGRLGRLDNIETSLGNIQNTLSTLNSSLRGIDNRLLTMDNRLVAIETREWNVQTRYKNRRGCSLRFFIPLQKTVCCFLPLHTHLTLLLDPWNKSFFHQRHHPPRRCSTSSPTQQR
jgi:hypothetical protein